MNVFFGMGVPGANPNDPSFFLRLPDLWPVFVIPIVCFYVVLAVWVVRKVKEASAVQSHGASGPPSGPCNLDAPPRDDEPPTETGSGTSPFDLHFYRAFPMAS